MSNVLVLVEVHAGEVRKSTFNAIRFGQQVAEKCQGEVHLAVIGHQVGEAAKQVANLGAAKVWTIDDAGFAHYLAESYATALARAAEACAAKTIAAASSSLSKDLLPRLAARLKAGMASDVLAVVGAKQFKRPMWAGNVIATVEIATETQVMTVRHTEFDAAAPAGASPVEALAVKVDPAQLKTRFVSLKEVKSERPDVATAARVVSGGRGVKSAEGFKVIEQLADALGAGVGASRAVCDAGWVPNDLQIGQTGKVVAPSLYIACGISGAIQHLAGMKGSKVIVAINKDPEAPIFQVADYGLVSDLFAAVPAMVAGLKA